MKIFRYSTFYSFREVFEDLHNQALEDNVFGTKLSIACSDAKVYSINDCNFRLILLQTLQKDFEGTIYIFPKIQTFKR